MNHYSPHALLKVILQDAVLILCSLIHPQFFLLKTLPLMLTLPFLLTAHFSSPFQLIYFLSKLCDLFYHLRIITYLNLPLTFSMLFSPYFNGILILFYQTSMQLIVAGTNGLSNI